MKKIHILCSFILVVAAVFAHADDDFKITKVVLSQKRGIINSEIVFARNERNFSSVVVWSGASNSKFESGIYAAYIKPKKDGSFKFSKARLISNESDYNTKPSIAYNSVTNSYMVVWSSQIKNMDTHILGRKLSATGRAKGGIVKIASEANAQNSSPQIAPYYLGFGGYGPEKGRFVLAYCKNWPSWMQNVYHGMHVRKLDAGGRTAGKETSLLASPVDPGSGESLPLLIGNIQPVFGPYHYTTITVRYFIEYDNVPKKPDTLLYVFGDVDDVQGLVRLYGGLYQPAQITTLNQDAVVTWVDAIDKQKVYVQHFPFGSFKGDRIRKPVKEKTDIACTAVIGRQMYLYNYGGGSISVYRIGPEGQENVKVATIGLPEPLGQEMKVYWGNDGSKAFLFTNEITSSAPYESDIVLYYFDAPDWENQKSKAGD